MRIPSRLTLALIAATVIVGAIGLPHRQMSTERVRGNQSISYSSALPVLVAGQPYIQDGFQLGTFADFDGDGIADWIRSIPDDENRHRIMFLRGHGTNTFDPPQPATDESVSIFYRIKTGDLTGDGVKDLVLQDFDSLSFRILRAFGDGSFAPYATVRPPPRSHTVGEVARIVVRDFDNDGLQDFAATVRENDPSAPGGTRSHVVIFFQQMIDGLPQFQEQYLPISEMVPTPLEVGDLDRNGYFDLVFGDFRQGDVGRSIVALNRGGRQFELVQPFEETDNSLVRVLDVNRDGFDDVVTFNAFPQYCDPFGPACAQITVDYGSPSLLNTQRQRWLTEPGTWVWDVGHYDSDGRLDLFGPEFGFFGDVFIMRYGSGGTRRFALPDGFRTMEPGPIEDLNRDAVPDVHALGEVYATDGRMGFFMWLSRVETTGLHYEALPADSDRRIE